MSQSKPTEPLLHWLHHIVIETVRHGHDDLTMRQLAIYLLAYGTDDLLTVRGLASMLRIPRPTVSRGLDHLCSERLVRREPDIRDRRSIVVRRTRHGSQRIEQLKTLMCQVAPADVMLPMTEPASEGTAGATSRNEGDMKEAGPFVP